jgi:valyl-tRNA synthetase
VAIHPEDERYLNLHGKKLRLPLMNREIPIILDEWVSRDFGTGAVKVTPAHDPNDFVLAERHHLPPINIMDDTGHINAEGGPYAGLERYAARKRVVADLEAQGLLAGIKDYVNNVGHCDRCKTVVEPRLSTQWFIKIQPLADKAKEAVRQGHIKFTPEMYEKTYFEWMENIHDWCISRQLWWGHRIPAWHCAECRKITVARIDPTACAHCGSKKITQETDVLDTWFSSGLLPVSVFGWPNITPETRADFDAFYPTSLLVTGFDILFFWVARMIMFGCWFAEEVPHADGSRRLLADSVPFREVYIHALVRDANREKMSKTKGNVLDPIEIVKTYGTDAVRFTLASMASPGTDIAFNIARTEGYRAFANKIWNAARFLFMNVDRAAEIGITVDVLQIESSLHLHPHDGTDADRSITSRLATTAGQVNLALENYRFDEAASIIYQFFWGDFCDWYLEIAKLQLDYSESADRNSTRKSLHILIGVFEAALRLLSPFMPFITEELWHAIYNGIPPFKSIALSQFPQQTIAVTNKGAESKMAFLKEFISETRAARKERGVEEKATVPLTYFSDALGVGIVSANVHVIQSLARTSPIQVSLMEIQSPTKRSTPKFDLDIVYEKQLDIAAERARLTKDIAKYEKNLISAERQLGNEGFLAKAPAQVVEGLKKQEAETRLLLEKARAALEALPRE